MSLREERSASRTGRVGRPWRMEDAPERPRGRQGAVGFGTCGALAALSRAVPRKLAQKPQREGPNTERGGRGRGRGRGWRGVGVHGQES